MTFGGSVERGQPGGNEKTVRLVGYFRTGVRNDVLLGPDDRMFQTVLAHCPSTTQVRVRSIMSIGLWAGQQVPIRANAPPTDRRTVQNSTCTT